MKRLLIFCDGGLGNRLGVIVGGFIIAKYLAREPKIIWPENTWCGCNFLDLFETSFEIDNSNINEVFNQNLNNICLIHENQTKHHIERQYYPSKENIDILQACNDPDILYYHNSIPDFIQEHECLEVLNALKIKKEIIDNVMQFCNQKDITNNVQGIHFRKTDYGNLIDENNIEKNIMYSSKKFFICSDDKETELKFLKYKNVIIRHKQNYVDKLNASGGWNDNIVDLEGRHFRFNVNRSKDAVIDGFIDMLILSRTNIVIDSISSFLKFSKLYNKIDLEKL